MIGKKDFCVDLCGSEELEHLEDWDVVRCSVRGKVKSYSWFRSGVK